MKQSWNWSRRRPAGGPFGCASEQYESEEAGRPTLFTMSSALGHEFSI